MGTPAEAHPAPPVEVSAAEEGRLRLEAGAGPAPEVDSRAANRLDRFDVRALIALTALALVLRLFSPLMPDFFSHPFSGAPISNCVHNTPIDAAGHLGTLCGLAYPFQKGTLNTTTHAYEPPDGEVFDEIYFGRFPYLDLKGIDYFDDKPPVGKLIVAAGEWTWGWFRATFQGAKGNYADLGLNTIGWRLAPLLFGTLLVPLMYLLARQLWRDRLFAVLAGGFACFDGMFFLQSRIAMLDIFLAFFIVLAYWLFLVHLDSRTPRSATVTLLLTGAALGFGIATKWSALAAWGTILLLLTASLFRRWFDFRATSWRAFASGPAISRRLSIPGGDQPALYVLTVALAFVLIPGVIYITSWFPFFLRGQFHSLGDIVHHDYEAYQFNANLKATHPFGSVWYSWPFLSKPVLYYIQYGLGNDHWGGGQLSGMITDLGNPWIWWTSLPCLVALLYFIVRRRSWPALVILLAFSAQYFPWSRVTRVLFLFEMGAMLPFMILALAFVLARIAQTKAMFESRDGTTRLPLAPIAYAHAAIAVVFFMYFYPLWTALPISVHALYQPFPQGKIWFPTWI